MNQEIREEQLKKLIKGCKKGKAQSQEALYRAFYGYALSISLRYCRSREEAEEIVNDSFLKVFLGLGNHRKSSSFKSWLRRILIHTAIDHYRQNEKHYQSKDIEQVYDYQVSADSIEQLSEKELIAMVQLLSPAYRMAFNLYAIEGYKHREIARKLDISIGTSKSNLAKARKQLRRILQVMDKEKEESYGR